MNSSPKQTQQQISPDDQDPIWDLIDRGSQPEISPTFVADTLRRSRLEKQPRFQFLENLTLPAAFVGATACLVAVALSLNLSPEAPVHSAKIQTGAPGAEIEDLIAHELLLEAAENPDSISDGELLALLF